MLPFCFKPLPFNFTLSLGLVLGHLPLLLDQERFEPFLLGFLMRGFLLLCLQAPVLCFDSKSCPLGCIQGGPKSFDLGLGWPRVALGSTATTTPNQHEDDHKQNCVLHYFSPFLASRSLAFSSSTAR